MAQTDFSAEYKAFASLFPAATFGNAEETCWDEVQSLFTNIDRASELQTHESNLYPVAGREFAAHKTVEHGWNQRGFYVGSDGQTTNAVENFFGVFKKGMVGVYHFCGKQHLSRYLAEFKLRHNHRSGLGVSDKERAAIALKGIEGNRLTYRRPH